MKTGLTRDKKAYIVLVKIYHPDLVLINKEETK